VRSRAGEHGAGRRIGAKRKMDGDTQNSREGDDPANGAWWETLVGRLLHPCQIQMIDALRRTDHPLTAGELFEACDGDPEWLRFVHLLRRLDNLGAVEPAGLPPDRNPFELRYRLARLHGRRQPQTHQC